MIYECKDTQYFFKNKFKTENAKILSENVYLCSRKANITMKRRISMLLILLANMLILAHAVVPHHHHNKMFVAFVNVLDHDSRDLFNHSHGHEYQHGDSDHHDGPAHHHDGNSEDCLMSEAEAAVALKIQADDGESLTADYQLSSFLPDLFLAAVGLYELSFAPDCQDNDFRRRPYIASGHTDFVARSKGLRAPPAC